MEITERQKLILESTVKEYVRSAEPVGSEFLKRHLKITLSPATIRNEMQELTKEGFLAQPHTSAGRVPTDKGYRFFVNQLLEKKETINKSSGKLLKDIKVKNGPADPELKFIDSLAKNLAERSSSLILAYFSHQDFVWKEGWKEVFQEPEFEESGFIKDFLESVEDLEENIRDFYRKEIEEPSIHIYIGREIPMLQSDSLSLIISQGRFSPEETGVIALLGPKRMSYDKNIAIMSALINNLRTISYG